MADILGGMIIHIIKVYRVIHNLPLQAEYLKPYLHGMVAFLNFILIRLEYFEQRKTGELTFQHCSATYRDCPDSVISYEAALQHLCKL